MLAIVLTLTLSQLVDPPSQNGDLSPGQLFEHMKEDPRVKWSFTPGPGRTAPPLTHPQFLEKLKARLDAGAPCPPESKTVPRPTGATK